MLRADSPRRCRHPFVVAEGLALLLLAPASHAAIASCNPGTLQAIAPVGVTIADIANMSPDPGLPKTTNGVAEVPADALGPGTPPFCLVTGTFVTNPATGKTANFGALLPDASSWNQRFMYYGCGFNCGVVFPFTQPAADLRKGYPIWGTDDGHTGILSENASWPVLAPGMPNPDTITDFAYRAVHTLTVIGKQFTVSYYNASRISYAYFSGCSDGGREGFVAATRYPEDYDGILAGAPYFDVPGEALNLADITAQLRATDAVLSPAHFALASQVVTRQCDAADGVTDGLIQNPAVCRFDPQTDLPRCAGAFGPGCFTQNQIDSLSNAIAAATDRRGRVIHPGFSVSDMDQLGIWVSSPTPPGNFTGPQPWANVLEAPLGWQWADPTVQYLAFWGIPGYNSLTTPGFTYEAGGPGPIHFFHTVVPDDTIATMFGRMNVASGDFAERIIPFLARGGKLILYHGYSDGLITPYGTVQYYRGLAHVLGGYERAQRSVQLYMVPGMYHCSGGPGPNNFGQPEVLPRDTDPLHDATRALEQWVENGIAPRMFIATKFTNDDLTQAPIRTMPLCPFPAQARYLGSGDVNDAANWQCPSNDRSQLEIGLDGRQAGLRAPLFTGERSRGHHGFDQDTGSAGGHRPDATNEGDRANGRR